MTQHLCSNNSVTLFDGALGGYELMPRRDDLKTILVLGSGPIKIGQAAEFDFSGSQAVRALREDGYEVILVNSNPATIQNDPEMADIVYIEPLLPDTVRRIFGN